MTKNQNIIHKILDKIQAFKAGDDTLLCEVVHPKNDEVKLPYSLAQASLEVGESSLPHRLSGSELYYFTAGVGRIFINNNEIKVEAGHVVLVPPLAEQYVKNDGDCKIEFLCVVTPPWSEDSEEVL